MRSGNLPAVPVVRALHDEGDDPGESGPDRQRGRCRVSRGSIHTGTACSSRLMTGTPSRRPWVRTRRTHGCLHDMIGNVWEWCEDGFDAEYYMKSPADDPPGDPSAASRVIRGGSWFDGTTNARPAFRDRAHRGTGAACWDSASPQSGPIRVELGSGAAIPSRRSGRTGSEGDKCRRGRRSSDFPRRGEPPSGSPANCRRSTGWLRVRLRELGRRNPGCRGTQSPRAASLPMPGQPDGEALPATRRRTRRWARARGTTSRVATMMEYGAVPPAGEPGSLAMRCLPDLPRPRWTPSEPPRRRARRNVCGETKPMEICDGAPQRSRSPV